MTIQTILHTLPTGNDPASSAVISVFDRGFYDSFPIAAAHPNLMAQFMRIVEEAGELDDACINGDIEEAAIELADVFIVLCQLAWKTGLDPAQLWEHETPDTKHDPFQIDGEPITTISICVGRIARQLRKHNGESWAMLHAELFSTMAFIRKRAGHMQIDFGQIVMDKLAADEKRGILHGETHLQPQVNGTKPEPTNDLTVFEIGDRIPMPVQTEGAVYRDFS